MAGNNTFLAEKRSAQKNTLRFCTARQKILCSHSALVTSQQPSWLQTTMSRQSRLLLTALACTVLFSLYQSQQSINCSQLSGEEQFRHSNRVPYTQQPALDGAASRPRSRAARTEPYKCGVLFFYHIPSTGGSSSELSCCIAALLPP
jgi:hypothetical protein